MDGCGSGDGPSGAADHPGALSLAARAPVVAMVVGLRGGGEHVAVGLGGRLDERGWAAGGGSRDRGSGRAGGSLKGRIDRLYFVCRSHGTH